MRKYITKTLRELSYLAEEERDGEATYEIAIRHRHGIGVKVDGAEWYRNLILADDRDSPEAQRELWKAHSLGVFLPGMHVKIDHKKAAQYKHRFDTNARRDEEGRELPNKYAHLGFDKAVKLALKGDPDAMVRAGTLYLSLKPSDPKRRFEHKMGFSWLQKAAFEYNHPEARYRLALIHGDKHQQVAKFDTALSQKLMEQAYEGYRKLLAAPAKTQKNKAGITLEETPVQEPPKPKPLPKKVNGAILNGHHAHEMA